MVLRLVEVFAVLAAPVECLAVGVLDAARVDAARGEHVFVLGGEIVAHDGDDAHLGEVAGGEREIGGRAAENLLALAEGGLEGIEGHRADYEDRHVMHPPLGLRYLPTMRSSLARVAAGIASGAVMMAMARACPHLQARCAECGDGFADDVGGVLRVLVEHARRSVRR